MKFFWKLYFTRFCTFCQVICEDLQVLKIDVANTIQILLAQGIWWDLCLANSRFFTWVINTLKYLLFAIDIIFKWLAYWYFVFWCFCITIPSSINEIWFQVLINLTKEYYHEKPMSKNKYALSCSKLLKFLMRACVCKIIQSFSLSCIILVSDSAAWSLSTNQATIISTIHNSLNITFAKTHFPWFKNMKGIWWYK